MEEEGEKMLGSFSGSGGMIMMGGTELGRYGEMWIERLDETQARTRSGEELLGRRVERTIIPCRERETGTINLCRRHLFPPVSFPQVLRGMHPRLTSACLHTHRHSKIFNT